MRKTKIKTMKPKDYCACDFPIIRNGEYCANCGKDIEPPKEVSYVMDKCTNKFNT